MRFRSIASGSNGNCIYTGTDRTHILIDAGISCKRIEQGLQELGISGKELSGILITHEHSDHIAGLKVLVKHNGVPVYGTAGTIGALKAQDREGVIDPALYHVIGKDSDFMIGDYLVHVIPTSHDANDPCAYRLEADGRSVAVMTDLGTWTEEQAAALQGLSGLLLEANHDIRMLETGSYPYVLKRRILSNFGHLSNEMSGKLLDHVLCPDLRFVLLGHLSEENNYPDLALLSVQSEIDYSDSPWKSSDFRIEVASRYQSSEVYEL